VITPHIFTQFQPYHPDWENFVYSPQFTHQTLKTLSTPPSWDWVTPRLPRCSDNYNILLCDITIWYYINPQSVIWFHRLLNTAVSLKNSVPPFLHSILSTFHSTKNGNEKCTENTHYFGRKAPLTGHENELKDSVCVADTTLGWILLRIWYVWLQKLKVLPYSQRTTMSTERGKN
jgi:hypothetical protein